MSETVYKAIKENLEEAWKEGFEKGRKETTEKIAIGFLMSGVDPDIVAAVTGYTQDELVNLLFSTI